MKKEYTLSQQFAIICLDGQSCIHRSAAKSAAVRGIAAAALLEELLPKEEDTDISPTKQLEMAEKFQKKLESGMTEIKRMSWKKLGAVEKNAANLLLADGGIEIVPDLLGCDMNYYTAEITMKSYRSDRDIYLSIVESVRGEILEDGPVTLECICLLWLMRESGCLHELFSTQEQERIQERLVALRTQSSGNSKYMDSGNSEKREEQEMADKSYINIIWKQEFHKTVEQTIKSCLKGKREIFKNPYLEGINLWFPFLDRRQAIFIDFVVLGTTVKERRQAVIDFLVKNGHHVEEVKSGTETLLRVDNAYYRIWPKTARSGRIPIQGANLQPVYR